MSGNLLSGPNQTRPITITKKLKSTNGMNKTRRKKKEEETPLFVMITYIDLLYRIAEENMMKLVIKMTIIQLLLILLRTQIKM
jgi:hypothetical protein